MEKQQEVVSAPTTIKQRANEILERALYIKGEAYDPKDIVRFALTQAGIKAEDFTNTEMLYVLNTCKQKNLNPMEGEISFFKAKNGRIQAIPKYTTQLEKLHAELAKDPNYITFNVYMELTPNEEWKATARADFNGNKGKYSKEISLYSADWKCSNGMARFMLMKQATLQFIRLHYPHIDLGYDIDELQTFDSGIKQNKPKDARVIDIKVEPKTTEEMIKELK